MSNVYKHIFDAVFTRLTNNWSATDIDYPATRFSPNPNLAWIQPRLTFFNAEPVAMGGGASYNRIEGDLHINVFVPVGFGMNEAVDYADTLRTLFPGGYLLATAGRTVRFEVPFATPEIEQPEWYQIPVVCPFTVDGLNL